MFNRSRRSYLGALLATLAAVGLLAGCSSDGGGGGNSNPIAGTDVTPPTAPAGVVAQAGGVGSRVALQKVDVSWQYNVEEDVAGYKVYFSTTPADDGTYELLGNVPGGTNSFSDERGRGYAYGYKVTAIDVSQNESDRSTSATVRLAAAGGGAGGKMPTSDPQPEPGQ